ncbi:MAG TPA: serine/threonine-protein kinase [Oligoflexia bacterium]|nr:serine/threonine-protein kinase [Oligoflexia bacterium]HMP27613.1 serine/threonine-protein kinase [Oligoflexia bacterium]
MSAEVQKELAGGVRQERNGAAVGIQEQEDIIDLAERDTNLNGAGGVRDSQVHLVDPPEDRNLPLAETIDYRPVGDDTLEAGITPPRGLRRSECLLPKVSQTSTGLDFCYRSSTYRIAIGAGGVLVGAGFGLNKEHYSDAKFHEVRVKGILLKPEVAEGFLSTPYDYYQKKGEELVGIFRPQMLEDPLDIFTSEHFKQFSSEGEKADELARLKQDLPVIGRIFGEKGQYLILDILGYGAAGVTLKVFNAEDKRLEAAKVPLRSVERDISVYLKSATAEYDNERRTFANLKHPNVCGYHRLGFIDNRKSIPVAFYQYLEGGCVLRELINNQVIASEESVDRYSKLLPIAVELAEGLSALHSAGIVHRDIKPDNIFVFKGGKPVIFDFGLIKSHALKWAMSTATKIGLRGDADVSRTTYTAQGVPGTPLYMAPEALYLFGGDKKLTADDEKKVDVYALGCALFELLTGDVFAGKQRSIFDRSEAIRSKGAYSGIDKRVSALLYSLGILAKQARDKDGVLHDQLRIPAPESVAEVPEFIRGLDSTQLQSSGFMNGVKSLAVFLLIRRMLSVDAGERPSMEEVKRELFEIVNKRNTGSDLGGFRLNGEVLRGALEREVAEAKEETYQQRRRFWGAIAGIASVFTLGGGATARSLQESTALENVRENITRSVGNLLGSAGKGIEAPYYNYQEIDHSITDMLRVVSEVRSAAKEAGGAWLSRLWSSKPAELEKHAELIATLKTSLQDYLEFNKDPNKTPMTALTTNCSPANGFDLNEWCDRSIAKMKKIMQVCRDLGACEQGGVFEGLSEEGRAAFEKLKKSLAEEYHTSRFVAAEIKLIAERHILSTYPDTLKSVQHPDHKRLSFKQADMFLGEAEPPYLKFLPNKEQATFLNILQDYRKKSRDREKLISFKHILEKHEFNTIKNPNLILLLVIKLVIDGDSEYAFKILRENKGIDNNLPLISMIQAGIALSNWDYHGALLKLHEYLVKGGQENNFGYLKLLNRSISAELGRKDLSPATRDRYKQALKEIHEKYEKLIKSKYQDPIVHDVEITYIKMVSMYEEGGQSQWEGVLRIFDEFNKRHGLDYDNRYSAVLEKLPPNSIFLQFSIQQTALFATFKKDRFTRELEFSLNRYFELIQHTDKMIPTSKKDYFYNLACLHGLCAMDSYSKGDYGKFEDLGNQAMNILGKYVFPISDKYIILAQNDEELKGLYNKHAKFKKFIDENATKLNRQTNDGNVTTSWE